MECVRALSRAGSLAAWAVVLYCGTPQLAPAAEIDPTGRAAILQAAAARQDRLWTRVATAEPDATLGVRSLFAAALAFGEARVHPERLGRLFELAARMQDRDAQSLDFGNFRWYWRDERVTDRNAVEFCMQDAVLLWRRHSDWVPEPARRQLHELMEHGVEGCLRHRVRTNYTNIAVLNASNLILLGELFDRPDAAREGYRRLDAIVLWTWQFGTHEYCSPTYYYPDLSGLMLIDLFADREQGRQQARALAELLWTDIAVNWFGPARRLAGPQSRSYDYLYGLGGVDAFLSAAGWLDGEKVDPNAQLVPLAARWSPPEPLRRLSTNRFPRLVRQSWGENLNQSRTHLLYADVTLGCAGAAYGLQDLPLTVDLPGDRRQIHCYFIADGREDPYGKKKYETSSARHMKALHLEPFWAGAQRGPDALGLVVYRSQDLPQDLVTNVQSHFVLRRPDGIWLGGRPVALAQGTPGQPASIPVAGGQSLVLRYGTAAVGIRLVWARMQDGSPAPAALIDDGNPYAAARLTVEHRSPQPTAEAGAAFWVRVAGGMDDDAAFDQWRAAFDNAEAIAVETSAESLRIEVPGQDEPVSILAEAPYGRGRVELVPEPSRAVLELNGQDVGRALLESVEPVQSIARRMKELKPIEVPADGRVAWEAEAGLLVPGMTEAEDPGASGGRCVWQPQDASFGSSLGSTSWPLIVARAGRYWLWGRVLATTGENDSFFVQLQRDDGTPLTPRGAWHTGHKGRWSWEPVKLDLGKQHAPLELPAGSLRLVITARELGARLDQLMLSSDPNGPGD
jgi:hypothetical protein